MRQINLETWSRYSHFRIFNTWDYPHFNMCANVDLTNFYPYTKQAGISFTIAVVYIITRAANTIPEFRTRIREEGVVEHAVVHPSTTILTDNGLFTFCSIEYTQDFPGFAYRAAEQIAQVKNNPSLNNESGDNWLYMTSIPWVTFTSFMHPLDFPVDSIPRFAWGKFFMEGQLIRMPLSVQGHHALMDGLHMGMFYEKVQEYFYNPNSVLK